MPRQRQRIVFCDCFDCRDRPDVSFSTDQLDAATSVARQEPPPKALLLFATGLVVASDGETNLDLCTLPHINLLVRDGNLGLLAVRSSEPKTGTELSAAVAELAQLLGVYQEVVRGQQDGADGSLPSLAARFKGMQAAFASTSAAARQLAQRLGMAVVDSLNLERRTGAAAPSGAAGAAASMEEGPVAENPSIGSCQGTTSLGLPDAAKFAEAVSAELGAAEGSSGRDLLLLHLDLDDLMGLAGAPEAPIEGRNEGVLPPGVIAQVDADARWDAGSEALEWLDSLIKDLLTLPEIRDRTLLVLMLSPAGHKMPAVAGIGGVGVSSGGSSSVLQPGGVQIDPSAVIVTPRNVAQVGRGGTTAAAAAVAGVARATGLSVLETPEYPLVTRPKQSFELLGMASVETDVNAPVLVARRLPGIVRRDRAERLGYKEALTAGAVGAILIDRLLPDIAYKIARAPKYGA